MRRCTISSGGSCIGAAGGAMRMIAEQPRSAQMYVPTVSPLRPASPLRGAANSVTCAPGCGMWQREHIALMPFRMRRSAARSTNDTGWSPCQTVT